MEADEQFLAKVYSYLMIYQFRQRRHCLLMAQMVKKLSVLAFPFLPGQHKSCEIISTDNVQDVKEPSNSVVVRVSDASEQVIFLA